MIFLFLSVSDTWKCSLRDQSKYAGRLKKHLKLRMFTDKLPTIVETTSGLLERDITTTFGEQGTTNKTTQRLFYSCLPHATQKIYR